MTEKTHDNDELYAYLLGALGEDETARFDELSFTDDDFAGRLRAAEKELVDSYVAGRLGGADLGRFESHYLASPRRRRAVEFAGALREFLDERNAREIGAGERDADRDAGGWFEWLGAYRLRLAGLGVAFAALALVFVAIGLWREGRRVADESAATERRREELRQRELEIERQIAAGRDDQSEKPDAGPRPDDQQAANKAPGPASDNQKTPPPNVRQSPANDAKNERRQTPTLATIFLAPPLRGGNVPVLRFSRATTTVAATLELETAEFPAVRVALTDDAGKTLWTSGATAVRGGGRGKSVVRVDFPTRNLQSRNYTLTVSGLGATGEQTEIGSYPLRIVVN